MVEEALRDAYKGMCERKWALYLVNTMIRKEYQDLKTKQEVGQFNFRDKMYLPVD